MIIQITKDVVMVVYSYSEDKDSVVLLPLCVFCNGEVIMQRTGRIGYFSKPEQEKPTYDPGLDIKCLVCNKKLSMPIKTISFLVPNDQRSYFYRLHKICATEENQKRIEGPIVDAIYEIQETGNNLQWGEA